MANLRIRTFLPMLMTTTFLSSSVFASALEVDVLNPNSTLFSHINATKYNYEDSYKTVLNSDNSVNFKNIVFEEIDVTLKDEVDTDFSDNKYSKVIKIELPNNQIKYFKYIYTKADGRIVYQSYQSNLKNNIEADFVGIKVFSSSNNIEGSALNNKNKINIINGDFIGNYAEYTSAEKTPGKGVFGVALFNDVGAKINAINGDFIHNLANGKKNAASGAAIYNHGSIGKIVGNFIANSAVSDEASSYGGAIRNSELASINEIIGDFVDNNAKIGGAIFNKGTMGEIIGNFVGNNSQRGGAIHNDMGSKNKKARIAGILGDFIKNHVELEDGDALGGAIYNELSSIDFISGNFINNYAKTSKGLAYGGAILTTANAKGNSLESFIIKSNDKDIYFSDNYIEDERGKIYNAIHVAIASDKYLEKKGISNNQEYNSLTFDVSSGNNIIINDSIDGSMMSDNTNILTQDRSQQYNVLFKGNEQINDKGLTQQYVEINNDIINAGKITVENTTLRFGAYQHDDKNALNWDGKGGFWADLNADGTVKKDGLAVTSLYLKNGAFDIHNGYADYVSLKGYSSEGGYLHIDVDVENLTSDVLNINGNVEGTTNVLVYANSDKDIRGQNITFAQSINDLTGNDKSFNVWRVYGSPYMYDVKFTQKDGTTNQWDLIMNDNVNPDGPGISWTPIIPIEPEKPEKPENPDNPSLPNIPTAPEKPGTPDNPLLPNIPTVPSSPTSVAKNVKVAPEVVAYGALPIAGIEQTRNMISHLESELDEVNVTRRAWANPVYYQANLDNNFDVETKVNGLDAGADLQYDENNRLGVFASYRQGEYNMSGNGDKYYATIGSGINIDSYVGGVYYYHNHNNVKAVATVYGGLQKADIKTDDGVKANTDGMEFGASAEIGYDYALENEVVVTPSLGMQYTEVSYDDSNDNAGKKAKYEDAVQIEMEAGVKVSKVVEIAESSADIYVKPSLVRTFVKGGKVKVNGLNEIETIDDENLIRIELGGKYNINEQVSTFGWANYSYGADYDASTLGVGLNYAF